MLNLEKKFSKRKSLIIILTQVGIFIAQYFLNESKVHFLFTVMVIMSLFHFKLKYILISILAILSLWLSYFFTSMHPLKFIFTEVFGLNLSKNEKINESGTFLLNEDVKTQGEIKNLNDGKVEQKNIIDDVKKEEKEKSHESNEKNNLIESLKEETNEKDEENDIIEDFNKDKNEKFHECNEKNNLVESSKEESNENDEQNNLIEDLYIDNNEKSQNFDERNDVLESLKEKLNEKNDDNKNHDNITESKNEKKENLEEIKNVQSNNKIIKIMRENIDKIPRRKSQNISNEIAQEEKLKYQSSQENREECELNKSETKCSKSDNEKTNDSNPNIKIFETEESILDESLVKNDKPKYEESKNTSTPVEAEKISDRCNESLTDTIKNITKRSYSNAIKNLEKRKNTKEKKQKSVKFKENRIKDKESSSDNEICMLNLEEKVDKSSQEPKYDENIILQIESANCEEVYSRLGFKAYEFSFKLKNISVIQNYLKEYFIKKDEKSKMKCFEALYMLFNKHKDFSNCKSGFIDLIEEINNKVNNGKTDQVKVKYVYVHDYKSGYLISLLNTIENRLNFSLDIFHQMEDSKDTMMISNIMVKRKLKDVSPHEIEIVFLLK